MGLSTKDAGIASFLAALTMFSGPICSVLFR